MERKKYLNRYSKPFLYIIYLVGLIGHLVPATRDLMLLLTPITILVTGVIVISSLLNRKSQRIILWLVIVYLITFAIEALAVRTGLIFGDYSYGDTLGPKLFDVPIIIGINWTIVIMGALDLARAIIKNKFYAIVLAALLAVAFDFVLEPVAVSLNYWSWTNDIPVQNYFAWFVISCLAAYVFIKMNIKYDSKLPRICFYIQSVYFLILRVFVLKT